jgi:Putative DNA-binding domain
VGLVEAVRDAAPHEQETNALEWKGSLDLSSKRDQTKIVKAVLSFANRQPDEASRAFGGCAYLLVGVEPGALAGIQPIDAAKLESSLVSYIGSDVQWRPDYVDVDGRSVLVVAVEPPQWGGPAHPVRKSFSDGAGELLSDGDIFVRHHASSDPAKATDIDALSRRAARAPGDELDVDVRLTNETPLRRLDLREESVQKFADERRQILLRSLSAPGSVYGGFPTGLVAGEFRTKTDYQNQVEKYAQELTEKLPSVLAARSILMNVGRLELDIVNDTAHPFARVRVELLIPDDVPVCVWQDEAQNDNRHELPPSPAPYGKGSRGHAGILIPDLVSPFMTKPAWVPSLGRSGDKRTVVFADKDVRAESTAELPYIWLIVDDKAPVVIPIEWRATAHDAKKKVRGTIDVKVADEYVSTLVLLHTDTDDEK